MRVSLIMVILFVHDFKAKVYGKGLGEKESRSPANERKNLKKEAGSE